MTPTTTPTPTPQSSASANDLPTLPVANPTRSFWHTTHPNPLVHHRTTPDLPRRGDVVVIGSGITGAFAARELVASGTTSVVVLEAREICSGATGRNGGHCQPLLYFHPPSSATFEVENFLFLSNFISKSNIPCDFSKFSKGGCHAYYSRQTFEQAKTAIRELESLYPNLSSQVQVTEDRAMLSSLKIPHAVGAIFQLHAAGLHPYKLVTWLWSQLLESLNLNLQTGTPVTSISASHNSHTHDRWTLATPRGTISTPHVLLATNGYTAHLLPDSFRSLIVPVQGQMSALRPPSMMLEKSLEHDYTFVGREQDDYLVQRPLQAGGHFMFGGGRRVAEGKGVGVSDDSKLDGRVASYLRKMVPKAMNLQAPDEVVEHTETGTPSVPEGWEYVEALKDGSTERELEAEAEWTGVMGYSRDGCPWVGGVPGQEGLWICGGYTGHGMPNASLSANHIGRLIIAASQQRDWREVEKDAMAARSIPPSYVVTEERMHRARQLPEVKGDFVPAEAKL